MADKLFREATDHLQHREDAIDKVDTTFAFVEKLTPHAIRAARSLSSECVIDPFNHCTILTESVDCTVYS